MPLNEALFPFRCQIDLHVINSQSRRFSQSRRHRRGAGRRPSLVGFVMLMVGPVGGGWRGDAERQR